VLNEENVRIFNEKKEGPYKVTEETIDDINEKIEEGEIFLETLQNHRRGKQDFAEWYDPIFGTTLSTLKLFLVEIADVNAKIERRRILRERAPYRWTLSRIISDPPNMTLLPLSTDSSKSIGSMNNRKAEAALAGGEFFQLLEEFNPSIYSTESEQSFPSLLLCAFGMSILDGDTIHRRSIHSRADMLSLVGNAVEDAKKLAFFATGRKLLMLHQPTLFSFRNDHLIVYDREMDIPIAIVEIQMPNQYVKHSPHGVGEIFDAIVAMQAFQQSTPTAVITSFNTSILLWHDDARWNDIVRGKGSHRRAIIKSTISSITNHLREDNQSPLEGDGAGESPIPTPEQLQKKEEIDNESWDEDTMVSDNTYGFATLERFMDRKLLRSNEYDCKKLIHVIYTAIICGLARNIGTTKQKGANIRPTNGVKKGIALKLVVGHRTKYSWVRLNAKLGQPIKDLMPTSSQGDSSSSSSSSEFDSESSSEKSDILTGGRQGSGVGGDDDDAYFVIGYIGRGNTSKVFLALDRNGNECVIKMHLERFDYDNNCISSRTFNKLSQKRTMTESRALTTAFPILMGKVYAQQINGIHCVIMPFFKPIAKKDRTDPILQQQIRDAITVLHTTTGKKYWRHNMCWYHIGTYGGGQQQGQQQPLLGGTSDDNATKNQQQQQPQIILFALADLIDLKEERDDYDADTTLPAEEVHMRELIDRIDSESESDFV
jgi:hypothetical protein